MNYIQKAKLFLPVLLLVLVPLSNLRAEIVNRVYAVVGDKVITQYDLEMLNPAKLRLIYEKFKGDDREEALKDFYTENLNDLIDNYVVEIAAEKEGVKVSDKEAEAAIDDIMQRNNIDRGKLDQLLEAQHQTYEQYRWKIKIDILTSRLIGTVFRPKIVVTDDDIKQYIAENQSTLDLSDMVELRVLHVTNKDKLDEAMASFDKNKDFRDVAMKYSDDKTASEGGYLGWVELSLLSSGVREAVNNIKQGISKPIEESDGGYRVFYVEGYKSKSDVNTDQRAKIANAIINKRAEAVFNDWIKEKKQEILIQKKY